MFRAGIFNDPRTDDPEFNHQHQAEEYCKNKGKLSPSTPYAVWDDLDNTLYMYFDYEEFEPRK